METLEKIAKLVSDVQAAEVAAISSHFLITGICTTKTNSIRAAYLGRYVRTN